MDETHFSGEFGEAYPNAKTHKEQFVTDHIVIDVPLDVLIQTIPSPRLTNPVSFDAPGPIEVWFGRTGNNFFDLVYHHALESATLATHSKRPDEKYIWSILMRFT